MKVGDALALPDIRIEVVVDSFYVRVSLKGAAAE